MLLLGTVYEVLDSLSYDHGRGEGTRFSDSSTLANKLIALIILDVFCGSVDKQNAPIIEKGKSPRLDMLLNAEEEVLKVGGNVVRLAGLYISLPRDIFIRRLTIFCILYFVFLCISKHTFRVIVYLFELRRF